VIRREAAGGKQLVADVGGKREIRDALAVEVTDLVASGVENDAAEPMIRFGDLWMGEQLAADCSGQRWSVHVGSEYPARGRAPPEYSVRS